MTDPIADMLSRIRNALIVNRTVVELPYSSMKFRLAEELKKLGFIQTVSTDGEGVTKTLILNLRDEDEPNRITVIERVSKPGRRMYAKSTAMPKVMSGRGVMIVSTSKGFMTDREAREQHIGGELICKVY